ncbi:hypothetical protein F7725_019792 [Dissostichus mawsoni]|uniref:Probable arginine--tRNA ligase, mitochondrial n=1 Tax=Dissostichus mawsoni TaxID=36200 RepID=A0A7J5YLP2_DISMA|nr:hypothetical protein F7725_019792 [Dissostichus mawsoni]
MRMFIPALSAVPVFRKQLSLFKITSVCPLFMCLFCLLKLLELVLLRQSPDFKLSINTLRSSGVLPSSGDTQQQSEELANRLKQDSVVEDISAGNGVINFKVNRKLLVEKMLEPFGKEDDHTFGLNSELFKTLKKGTTLVEYSSPNIAKKFHAGHLRSTIIGNFIANLKQSLGNNVIRMNYLGDWGMQFGEFARSWFGKFGCQEKLKQNPLQHLFEVYVQVNKEAEHNEDTMQAARDFFRQLEQHESEAVSYGNSSERSQWTSINRLNVHFDLLGESFHQHGAQEVVQQLQSRGLLKTSEYRADGTTLYITRDLAAAIDRKEKYNFDEMIYVTDKGQANHFNQLFHVLRALGHSWADRCEHVPFGLVRGMSTRSGEVVFLEDVLNEARNRMLHNMSQSKTTKEMDDPEDTAEKVGISALIVQAQGDTGVFLQYTHARLCSLIRRNEGVGGFIFDPSLLLEPTSIIVLQHLLRYDEVLYQSSQDLQPKHLVNFLLKLCHLVASAHRELPVKGSSQDVAQARLRLFSGAGSVLPAG